MLVNNAETTDVHVGRLCFFLLACCVYAGCHPLPPPQIANCSFTLVMGNVSSVKITTISCYYIVL